MNDNIQKLYENASLVDSPTGTRYSLPDEFVEKFAELIVRECADICMEMAAKCAGLPGDGALAKDCADWIKKDFGVEEK